MKKLVLALTAVAAFTGSALAADLPARTYTKAPVMPEPVYNWTGFYVFGGVGGGIWDADSNPFNNVTGVPLQIGQRQGGDGWFGTVGAGYDWQFNQTWVAGVFADGQFGSLKGSIPGAFDFTGVTGTMKLQDTWAVGGRIGWLVAPNVLSYVNAGFTQSYWSGSQLVPLTGGLATATTPAFNRSGWFVGGGVENNFDIFGISAPGWFMKTEYRMAFFDGINLSDSVPGGPAVVVIPGIGGFANPQNSIHFKPDVQTISTSLVYRFNWGGPLVAKY
jgi:outer membrane immunogenic protein